MPTSKLGRIQQTIFAAALLVGSGSASTAYADDIQFLLLGGTTQKLSFLATSSPGITLLQLGSCSRGLCNWAESGRGSVSYGQNQLEGYSGLWSLSIPYSGSTTYNLTLTAGFNGNPSDWGITQPSPINFTWGKFGCSGANCLLTGNLELTDLVESGNGGTFNLGMGIGLSITGGMLASLVSANDIFDYTITFGPGSGLDALADAKTRTATGSSGEVQMPAIEPTSLVLFVIGLGLLEFVRRRNGHARRGVARRN